MSKEHSSTTAVFIFRNGSKNLSNKAVKLFKNSSRNRIIIK